MSEYRILVVEDDVGTSRLVGEILRSEEIEIEYAADGVDALETLRTSVPDLVVLDLALPDGHGEELFPFLKKNGNASTPVIVFSAQDVSEDITARVQAVLVKSKTTNDALLNTIRSWVTPKDPPDKPI